MVARLEEEYFDWLCRQVLVTARPSYHDLLQQLNSIPFNYYIPLDGNRAADGISLRYRFGDESGIPHYVIGNTLDDHPCTVLELMVALALIIEERFMLNPLYECRTHVWFHDMLISLNLADMDDANIDNELVADIVNTFMSRNYDRDGKGGLFTIPGRRDMRDAEIWYQMNWYINRICILEDR